jgi:dipeptidase E
MSSRILAFSSSRTGNGGYLENAKPIIENFLGRKALNIAFIPFADVTLQYNDYTEKVKEGLSGLNHNIETVLPETAKKQLEKADAIMVGGGNTFKLLSLIYSSQILDLIRDKVNAGIPFIGWSAGSNILCPTICTTNDMPITEPKSFNALGLFPFQTNPHYYNTKPDGFNGETRDQRLTEFIIENNVPVVCLPEGTALKLENNTLTFTGECNGILLQGEDGSTEISRKEIAVDEDLSWLL